MSNESKAGIVTEEEDPFYSIIERTGCSQFHFSLQDCYDKHKNWKNCATEMKKFKDCMSKKST